MATYSYKRPKTITRKVRNILKRVFDNKGYFDEKQMQSMERRIERETYSKSKREINKKVDDLLEKTVVDMIKNLPKAPTHDPAAVEKLQKRLTSLKKGGTRKKIKSTFRKSTFRKSRAKQ